MFNLLSDETLSGERLGDGPLLNGDLFGDLFGDTSR